MFGMLKGLIDSEGIVYETIQDTLEKLSAELSVDFNHLFVMIKPTDENFEHKYFVYRLDSGKPEFVREITLKEILGSE